MGLVEADGSIVHEREISKTIDDYLWIKVGAVWCFVAFFAYILCRSQLCLVLGEKANGPFGSHAEAFGALQQEISITCGLAHALKKI
jgi:hypothetical protein